MQTTSLLQRQHSNGVECPLSRRNSGGALNTLRSPGNSFTRCSATPHSLGAPKDAPTPRRTASVVHASSEAAIDTLTGNWQPHADPHRASHDTRGVATPKQPVLKARMQRPWLPPQSSTQTHPPQRMMSWLRDLALDSFSSYDEEDGEVLTPTTALAASATGSREVPALVRPVHPSRRRQSAPSQKNNSSKNTPSEPPSPKTRRVLDALPTLCPLGAHDADVSAYLQNIGMNEESVVWARLNVPELFDMPVATCLKPGYKRLFDMPNPPSALVCQLKAVAALHYLDQLGMAGAPTQSTAQSSTTGATATTTVPGTVYNAQAVEHCAVAGGLESLYDTVDAHLKPLVALLQRSALDVKSVVKVWGEMPTFFTSSYLPSVTETTTFLSALGLEDGTIAAFVASINPSGPPLQLEDKLSFLLDSAGLTRTQVAQVFREFPGIMTLDLERTLQPVVQCMRAHPRQAGGLTQAEVMRLVTGHPSLLGMPPATLEDLLEFLHSKLGDKALVVDALAARKDAPIALNCSLASTAVRDIAEAFTSVGFSDDDVAAMTRAFPGIWTCNVSGKRHGPKVQYWREELGFDVPAMTACPRFLSYNLVKHVGPRVAAARAAQLDVSPASLHSLLAKDDAEFAGEVCGASVEEWEAFKTSWQNSRDGRRWHCSADDIPGRANGMTAMGGDGLGPSRSGPVLTRFNTFKLTPEDLPLAARPPPRAPSGPLQGDGM